ncbi:MAG TPA: hypothetical protein VJP41_02410, partial [Gaiellaceae bacterium]|nr:hypothetical protein [Gaiellaceae bacterium]
MPLRVSRRSLWVAVAGLCVGLLALTQGSTSLASAGTGAARIHTYTTKGTLPFRTALLDPF